MVLCKYSFGWFLVVERRVYRGIAISTGVFVWCFAGGCVVFCGHNVVFRATFSGVEIFPLF
jgi:hypothetical protein